MVRKRYRHRVTSTDRTDSQIEGRGMRWEWVAEALTDTDKLGAALASCLPRQCVVGLNGTLGAGKTRLVQAIGVAGGIDPEVINSPTFVMCQHYEGQRRIHHIDAYRIADDDEFYELGIEELFEEDALCFIEWSQRVEDCLPTDRVEISIEVSDVERRRFVVEAHGAVGDFSECLNTHLRGQGGA